jgi:hypothetical protein
MTDLDEFASHYTTALLWSENLEGKRIPIETRVKIRENCKKFLAANQSLVEEAAEIYGLPRVSHDLALTRNRHGAGFWDGGLPEELGAALTDAAHAMGEMGVDCYRGWVYVTA